MKLNDNKENEYLFASCEINWKIENFLLASPVNEFTIYSPEFMLQGLKSVYWRMSLELQDKKSTKITDIEMSPKETVIEMSPEKSDIKNVSENGLVSVYLEMLPTSLVKNIFVNWEMILKVGAKVLGPYESKVNFEAHGKDGNIGIATTTELLEELGKIRYDTINIRFYFIALDKDKFSMPKDEKPPGIFKLGEDLKHFKDTENNYSDIKLNVKGEYIKAHKIVLSFNERFDIYIKQIVNDIVEISQFDYKTMDAFVNFLYSRKVSYCLEDLSIDMIRCLDHFNCDALKPYYIPEELPLNSKIHIKKHEYQWDVPDILDKNYFTITSPPIAFLDTSTKWSLTISVKANDPDKFVSIYAQIVAGDKPRDFCLEFALVNESGTACNPIKLVRHNQCYENLGFEKFIRIQDIRARRWVITGDCVCFLLRIKTSDGSQESSVGCHSMTFILPSKSKPHKMFAEKMLDFYKKETYGDITVLCKRDVSKANKFILAARSLEFRQSIKKDEKILSVWVIEPYFLRIILRYMYAGVLEQSSEVMLELFNISSPEKLDIPSLHEECAKYLRERNACFNVKRKY